MFSIFKKKEIPLLKILLNGKELCSISPKELPCEKELTTQVGPNGVVEFVDAHDVRHSHELGNTSGWFHFSLRVYENLACQTDCVITDSQKYDPEAFSTGKAIGVRFQPFFVSGAKVKNEDLHGKGLFARGLHFNGRVTSGNIILSCECDQCKKSFQIRSYHAGFSNSGYFYSGSGGYTLTVSDHVSGCPSALTEPDPKELAALEDALPLAPDGTRYKYTNPFRCPHCSAPYINFETYPKDRPNEYYGNYFVNSELIKFEPTDG
jgi:hypothetical protein